MDGDESLNINLGHGEELDSNFDFGGGEDFNFEGVLDTNTVAGGEFDFDFAAWDPLGVANDRPADAEQVEFDVEAYNRGLSNTNAVLEARLRLGEGFGVTTPASIAPAPTQPIAGSTLPPAQGNTPPGATESVSQLGKVSTLTRVPTPAPERTARPTPPAGQRATSPSHLEEPHTAERPTRQPRVRSTSAAPAPPSLPTPTPAPKAESAPSPAATVATPPAPHKEPEPAPKPTSQREVRPGSSAPGSTTGPTPRQSREAALVSGKSATPAAPRKTKESARSTLQAAIESTRRPTFRSAGTSGKLKSRRKASNTHLAAKFRSLRQPETSSTDRPKESDSLFIPDPEGEKEKQERINLETAVIERLFKTEREVADAEAVNRTLPPAPTQSSTLRPAVSPSPTRDSPTPPPPQLTSLTGPAFHVFTKKQRPAGTKSASAARSAQPEIKGFVQSTNPSGTRLAASEPITKTSTASDMMAQPQQRADSPTSAADSRSSTPRPTTMANKLWNRHVQRVSLAQPLSNDEQSGDDREPLRKTAGQSEIAAALQRPTSRSPANTQPAVMLNLPPAVPDTISAGMQTGTAPLPDNGPMVSSPGVSPMQGTLRNHPTGRESRGRSPSISKPAGSLLKEQATHKPPARPLIVESNGGFDLVWKDSNNAAPPLPRAASPRSAAGRRDLGSRSPAQDTPARSNSPAGFTARSTAMTQLRNRQQQMHGAAHTATFGQSDLSVEAGNKRPSNNRLSSRHSGDLGSPVQAGGSTLGDDLSSARPQTGSAFDRYSPLQPTSRFSSPLVPAVGSRTPPAKNFAPKSPARLGEHKSAGRHHEIARTSSERRSPARRISFRGADTATPETRPRSPVRRQPRRAMREFSEISTEDADAASILARAAQPRQQSPEEEEVIVSDESPPSVQRKRHVGLPIQEQMARDLDHQPSARRQGPRLTAAVPDVNTPSCDTLVHAAIQHLNNLILAFKLHEDEAHEREDHLAALHMQAQEMREDAMAWRRAAMPLITERRERLSRLIGLENHEVMRVEGWQELLRPLRIRDDLLGQAARRRRNSM